MAGIIPDTCTSPSPYDSSSYIRRKRLVQQIEKAKEERLRQVANKKNVPIEQEIECPRCHDVMTLHSEFDRLGYFCEEWQLFALFESLKKCYEVIFGPEGLACVCKNNDF